MNEKDLKEGKIFYFTNEKYCFENNSDDLRGGSIRFNSRFNLFGIFLMGNVFTPPKPLNP